MSELHLKESVSSLSELCKGSREFKFKEDITNNHHRGFHDGYVSCCMEFGIDEYEVPYCDVSLPFDPQSSDYKKGWFDGHSSCLQVVASINRANEVPTSFEVEPELPATLVETLTEEQEMYLINVSDEGYLFACNTAGRMGMFMFKFMVETSLPNHFARLIEDIMVYNAFMDGIYRYVNERESAIYLTH